MAARHHWWGAAVVTVHNFSYGLLNPALGYAMSCLGAFLGLRCVTRARAYTGFERARWLSLAAVSVGATGIWTMHFIAMLGFTIPGQQILYNIPITIGSMLIAIAVVGVGLFIVGFGDGGWRPLLIGGVIVGVGVATMHYMGMAAMSMPDSEHYNMPLFLLSIVIAIVAGTAALWAGTQVRGIGATIVASLIMGVAVTGMHYTGMAAMQVTRASMPTMGGSTSVSFLFPLVLGISLFTFVLTLTIGLSPSEDEIHAAAALHQRIETQFARHPQVAGLGATAAPPGGRVAAPPPPPPAPPSAFTPGGYTRHAADREPPGSPQPPPLPLRRPGSGRSPRPRDGA